MSGTFPSSEEPARPDEAMGDEISQLRAAVTSQRHIGMAIGLLSATYGCSTEEAWRTLLRVSQDSNTKIRTLAHALVTIHDDTADEGDRELLQSFIAHLPASGWPRGSRTGHDLAP